MSSATGQDAAMDNLDSLSRADSSGVGGSCRLATFDSISYFFVTLHTARWESPILRQ